MRRGIVAVLGVVCCTGLIIVVLNTPNRVYTVPEVLTSLSRAPGAWAGRSALVWGTALQLVPGCPRGQWCPSGLYKPDAARPGPILLLEPGPSDPLAVRLRRVPFVSTMVPKPQRLRWHSPAVYRLLFRAVPNTLCDARPCIDVLLADAA